MCGVSVWFTIFYIEIEEILVKFNQKVNVFPCSKLPPSCCIFFILALVFFCYFFPLSFHLNKCGKHIHLTLCVRKSFIECVSCVYGCFCYHFFRLFKLQNFPWVKENNVLLASRISVTVITWIVSLKCFSIWPTFVPIFCQNL